MGQCSSSWCLAQSVVVLLIARNSSRICWGSNGHMFIYMYYSPFFRLVCLDGWADVRGPTTLMRTTSKQRCWMVTAPRTQLVEGNCCLCNILVYSFIQCQPDWHYLSSQRGHRLKSHNDRHKTHNSCLDIAPADRDVHRTVLQLLTVYDR